MVCITNLSFFILYGGKKIAQATIQYNKKIEENEKNGIKNSDDISWKKLIVIFILPFLIVLILFFLVFILLKLDLGLPLTMTIMVLAFILIIILFFKIIKQ